MNASVKIFSDKAFDSLQDAEVLFQHERFSGCISRAYYAVYDMTQALLASKNLFSKSHSGLRHLFSEHFIRTNIFERSMLSLITKLFQMRQTGDYDFGYFTSSEANSTLEKARLFLSTAKKYLDDNIYDE